MAQTFVILIRVALGLPIGFAGLLAVSHGAYMVAHRDFTILSPLALTMLVGITIGAALLYGSWRLLSSTLRMPGHGTSAH